MYDALPSIEGYTSQTLHGYHFYHDYVLKYPQLVYSLLFFMVGQSLKSKYNPLLCSALHINMNLQSVSKKWYSQKEKNLI